MQGTFVSNYATGVAGSRGGRGGQQNIENIKAQGVCPFLLQNMHMLNSSRCIKDRSSFATNAFEFSYHSRRYTILLASCR